HPRGLEGDLADRLGGVDRERLEEVSGAAQGGSPRPAGYGLYRFFALGSIGDGPTFPRSGPAGGRRLLALRDPDPGRRATLRDAAERRRLPGGGELRAGAAELPRSPRQAADEELAAPAAAELGRRRRDRPGHAGSPSSKRARRVAPHRQPSHQPRRAGLGAAARAGRPRAGPGRREKGGEPPRAQPWAAGLAVRAGLPRSRAGAARA